MICPITELTKKLIRIPSVSPKDLGCQDIMINFLSNLGFKIKKIKITIIYYNTTDYDVCFMLTGNWILKYNC